MLDNPASQPRYWNSWRSPGMIGAKEDQEEPRRRRGQGPGGGRSSPAPWARVTSLTPGAAPCITSAPRARPTGASVRPASGGVWRLTSATGRTMSRVTEARGRDTHVTQAWQRLVTPGISNLATRGGITLALHQSSYKTSWASRPWDYKMFHLAFPIPTLFANLMFVEWAYVLNYLFIYEMTWNKARFTANILIFKEVNYGPRHNGW